MSINYNDIGKRIKLERKKRSITQEKLAENANISVVHMSNIENGNTKLSLPALVNIANTLNCGLDVLLCSNLRNNKAPASELLSDLLDDCTQNERTVIIETLQALKDSLRKNKKED